MSTSSSTVRSRATSSRRPSSTSCCPNGLDVAFADMVFLDDQRTNIRGAEALGIPSVWFDVTDPDTSYAEVRKLLGLAPEASRG